MPTVGQLAPATAASDADELLVSQNGIARSITRAQFLSGYQPELSLASGTVLGRGSAGTGGLEELTIGANLTLNSGTLSATATPYLVSTLPRGTVPGANDLVSIGQAGSNAAVPYSQFMGGISALTNINASQMLVNGEAGQETLGNLASTALLRTGDTMTGALSLAGDPTLPLNAVTKRYVDTQVGGLLPLGGGAMTGALTLSGNPTAPLHASTKQYVDAQTLGALPVAGGSMTGNLTLAADPTAAMHASTKQYVDGVGVSLEASGAKGDGITDDTAAINSFLAKFSSGQRVFLPAGKFYLINSGNVNLPAGVIVEGTAPFGNQSENALFTGCGFLLNPSYSIVIGYAAHLKNLKVLRAGLLTSPTASQVISAVSGWTSEALSLVTTAAAAVGTSILTFTSTTGLIAGMAVHGKGIPSGTTITSLTASTVTLSSPIIVAAVVSGQEIRFGASIGIFVPTNSGNNVLEDLQVVGFRTGILAMAGELYANRVQADCITILEATWAGDNAYLSNFHCVPYYGVTQGNSNNCWRRPGPAFYLHDQSDGWTLANFFALHWQVGYQLSNVGSITLIRCGYEKAQDGWSGTTGFLFQGHESSCQCFDGFAYGATINFDMQHTGEIQISNMSSVGTTDGTGIARYRLGTTSWGAIYNPMIVETGAATPVIVQPNVIRWKIVAPFIDGGTVSQWITIDPSSIGAVDLFMVRDANNNSPSTTETHLHEKFWLTTDPSIGTGDGSPQATLALEATTGGLSGAKHLELIRSGAGTGSLQSLPVGAIQPGIALVAEGNAASVMLAPGGGGIVAGIPDGTSVGGGARGASAVDLQMNRVAATQVASGAQAAIVGGSANTVTGQAGVSGGNSNTVTGTVGVAFGFKNSITGGQSSAPGGANASDRGRSGVLAWSSDPTVAAGYRQKTTQILGTYTTDATPTRLTADSAAPSGVNTVNIQDWTLYGLRVMVMARHYNEADAATWLLDGLLLHRGSGAATVTLTGGGTTITPMKAIGSGGAWSITVAADTVNGGLGITVIGAVGYPLHWVASVDATEVG